MTDEEIKKLEELRHIQRRLMGFVCTLDKNQFEILLENGAIFEEMYRQIYKMTYG